MVWANPTLSWTGMHMCVSSWPELVPSTGDRKYAWSWTSEDSSSSSRNFYPRQGREGWRVISKEAVIYIEITHVCEHTSTTISRIPYSDCIFAGTKFRKLRKILNFRVSYFRDRSPLRDAHVRAWAVTRQSQKFIDKAQCEHGIQDKTVWGKKNITEELVRIEFTEVT